MMRRMGAGKGLGIFNPGIGSGKLKYYCMTCGVQHNQLACPRKLVIIKISINA
jgi:hypothetical protein